MRTIKILLASLLLLLAAAGTATAHGRTPAPSPGQGEHAYHPGHQGQHQPKHKVRHAVKHLRHAMKKYRRPAAAVRAGYLRTDQCVELPDGSAGMGFHYVHPELIQQAPKFRHPAILVYVPTKHGGRKLGAVEWFAADADQDLRTDGDRPHFGKLAFEGPMEGHEPGMPIHYDLHAWLFKRNPDGLFTSFNPRVHC